MIVYTQNTVNLTKILLKKSLVKYRAQSVKALDSGLCRVECTESTRLLLVSTVTIALNQFALLILSVGFWHMSIVHEYGQANLE